MIRTLTPYLIGALVIGLWITAARAPAHIATAVSTERVTTW